MALRTTYAGRRNNRQQLEKDFDNNYNDAQDEHRLENIYGGDERNYGNANQGSFDREWWERMRNRFAGWFSSDKETNRHSGQYGGIGPKNYKRNEQRIYEDVCDLLMEND